MQTNTNHAFTGSTRLASGTCIADLPEEWQAPVRKTYFDRSPYASIQVLTNGRALVYKHVTGTYIPCANYNAAVSQRNELVQSYVALERCFR